MIKYGVEFVLGEEKEMMDAVFDTSKEAYKAGRKLLEEIKLQGRLKDAPPERGPFPAHRG